MKCLHCGTALPDGAHVCTNCGRTPGAVKDSFDGERDTFSGRKRLMDGRYEIVCELGRGGMGVVYQAIDHARGADVALKMLPQELQSDARAVANLKREVNLALQLSHENICRVYDFQQCPEGQFIAMEYIDGPSLERLLVRQMEKGKNGFPLEKVLKWIEPICVALDYAHGKGIIHRDIKPANILINNDGVVKITDFGLARVIRTSMSRLSREPISGTALYMSPEQCRGKKTDARSDIYSLGMMTYELLAGEAPFADAAEVVYCQIHEDVEPLDGPGDAVNAALLAATAKEPENRPGTAGQFLQFLDHTGPEVSSTPPRVRTPVPSATEPKPGVSRTFAGIEMVWIPPGEFMMGSPEDEQERLDNEGPRHRVTFAQGFWLGKYEVTQAQWQAVMGGNPSYFKGDGKLPVECVSWDDCQEFIRKLNAKGEGAFRLPSEAEWEYACRAGTTTPFAFGETISTDQANYNGNYTYGNGRKGVFRYKTTPVGSFQPNAWRLYDMHGNVWEWCQDWSHDSYSGAPADGIAWETPLGQYRVLRGGSRDSDPGGCRSAHRLNNTPDRRYNCIGFRVALFPAAAN